MTDEDIARTAANLRRQDVEQEAWFRQQYIGTPGPRSRMLMNAKPRVHPVEVILVIIGLIALLLFVLLVISVVVLIIVACWAGIVGLVNVAT